MRRVPEMSGLLPTIHVGYGPDRRLEDILLVKLKDISAYNRRPVPNMSSSVLSLIFLSPVTVYHMFPTCWVRS